MPGKKQTKSIKKRTHVKRARFHERLFETDSTYFLKLVVIFLIGTFWLKFATPFVWQGVTLTALPLGLIVGVLVVRAFEHHQDDRKIWYVVLLFVTVVSFFGPAGIIV